MEDSIAIRETIPALVKAYDEIESMIRSVYDAIDKTKSLAYATFGDDARHRCIVPQDCKPYISTALLELRACAWRYIMRRCLVVELISQKRHNELSKRFEEGDVPPFIEQNVFATIESIRQGLSSMIQESIMEAYEILRPRHDPKEAKEQHGGATQKCHRQNFAPKSKHHVKLQLQYQTTVIKEHVPMDTRACRFEGLDRLSRQGFFDYWGQRLYHFSTLWPGKTLKEAWTEVRKLYGDGR